VLIGVCALAMLLCSGRIRRWHLLAFLPVAVAGMWWFIAREPYRMRRMLAFTDPWAAPRGEGYHMVQSLLSFSTGGLTGRGLGNGVQKLGYLPEDTTDFIFAVVCEELGLFGALLVLSLYAGILYVAWQVIASPREPLARMLALGIATMVGLQATINVAVATVSVPTKGLSLPLVSAGGSGLIIACGALGLLYGVCRWAGPETAVDETVAGNAVVPPAPRASAVTAPGESSGVSEADWREWTVTR
jgi:cell division protein FtsW